MELEAIVLARLRVLKENHGGRISALEDRSSSSSQRSDERWSKIEWWAEKAPKIVGLLRVIYGIWPLLVLAGVAIWTQLLPGLRWLGRLISSVLAWLAGLGIA